MKVAIVGGGWAGLAAAVELARHGVPPTILESARQLGGRARAVRFGPFHVDNGQHIILGAFRSTLSTLRTLGVSEASVLRRHPLALTLLGRDGDRVCVRSGRLPAPLHVVFGLLRTQGLSIGVRLAALRLLRAMRRESFNVNPDMPVARFLEERRQPPEAIRALWRPLCLAALNMPPADASAKLFLRVVRDLFFTTRHDSDLLLPILDLSACLPEPATDYIENRGGGVRLGARVQALQLQDGAVTGVVVRNEVVPADHVIVAVPPDAARDLLAGHAKLATLVQRFDQLVPQPICTVYLRYPDGVSLEHDFVGLLDTTVQWVFDRGRLTGDRGLMAAVISGSGPHMRLSNQALIEHVAREIAKRFPAWPAPLDSKLIRERRATLAARPGIDRFRPGHATPVRGLWLAGDYTAAGYPSTLEGAVRSGLVCARWILRHASGDLPRRAS